MMNSNQRPRQNRRGSRGLALAALTLAVASILGALPAKALSAERPEFVTLGTAGGPRIYVERSQPANAVVVGGAAYLFDTGDGVQRQMKAAGLSLEQVRAVFISHHHLDHNAGLGPLIMNRWLLGVYGKIPVIGPPGTAKMIRGMAAAFRPVEVAPITIGGPPKPLLLSTLQPQDLAGRMDAPRVIYEDENIRVLAITNNHFNFEAGSVPHREARSYSYRIESRGRSMVYTGDTGPSPNLERLAQGADLLVSEVIDLPRELEILKRTKLPPSMIEGLMAHMELDHLTPSQIGQMASRAGVAEVVLTHLVPTVEGDSDLSGFTEGLRNTFKGKVHIAKDLDRF